MRFSPDPWQVPPPDGIQRPLTIQVDVKLPSDSNEADVATLLVVAQGLIDNHEPRLNHWINGMRQEHSISGRDFSIRHFDLDGLQMRWAMNSGQEKMNLTLYPALQIALGGFVPDINQDGYVCWVHYDQGYGRVDPSGQPVKQGPYNIFFNGYLIEQSYTPLGPTGGYPILFGSTALLCDSYVGTIEKKDPLLNDTSLKQPFKVTPPNGWGTPPDGAAPDGTVQNFKGQQIPRTLGYWIFDWDNTFNPCRYLRSPAPINLKGDYRWYNWDNVGIDTLGHQDARLPLPQFNKGMYFKTASKSPLASYKTNNVGAINVQANPPGGAQIVDVWIAEFYDRGKFRSVTQSWTLAPGPLTYLVNDYPLIFGSAVIFDTYGTDNTGIIFNLDPKQTRLGPGQDPPQLDSQGHALPQGDEGLLGPHDGIQSGGGGSGYPGLNDDEISVYIGWQNQIAQIYSDFNTRISALLKPLLQHRTKLQLSYGFNYKLAIVGRSLAGQTQRYEKIFSDYNTLYLKPDGKTHYTVQGPYTNTTLYPPPTPVVVATAVTEFADGKTPNQTTISYGAAQQYWVNTSYALSSFEVNAVEPVQSPLVSNYQTIVPGTQYSRMTGDPYGQNTVYTGAQYQVDPAYTAGLAAQAFAQGDDDVFGPFPDYTNMLKAIDTQVNTWGDDLLHTDDQITALENQKPPALPPIPDLGDDSIEKFEYSNITISGDNWSYQQ